MTEWRRRPKTAGTHESVQNLMRRLEAANEEKEAANERVNQAYKVLNRWRETHNRRCDELIRIQNEIDEITRALDILAPEVDEYGITRPQREGSERSMA